MSDLSSVAITVNEISHHGGGLLSFWQHAAGRGILRAEISPKIQTENQRRGVTLMIEAKTTPKLPAELIELYNVYIHGGMSRREFFDSTKKYAVGGLTAAAIVEALMPNYAMGQQVAKDDKSLKTGYETVQSPMGNGTIKGYFVRPASAAGKLPGILVVHENRGL